MRGLESYRWGTDFCYCSDFGNVIFWKPEVIYIYHEDISDAIRPYRAMIEYHNDFLKKQMESFYLGDQEFGEIKNIVMQRDEDIEGKLEGYRSKLRNEIKDLHREISSQEISLSGIMKYGMLIAQRLSMI